MVHTFWADIPDFHHTVPVHRDHVLPEWQQKVDICLMAVVYMALLTTFECLHTMTTTSKDKIGIQCQATNLCGMSVTCKKQFILLNGQTHWAQLLHTDYMHSMHASFLGKTNLKMKQAMTCVSNTHWHQQYQVLNTVNIQHQG